MTIKVSALPLATACAPATDVLCMDDMSGGGAATQRLVVQTMFNAMFGIAAGNVCEGNDARLSNSRAPTGAAGGGLGGTYPNPTVNYGAVAGTACEGSDARLSDARAPTGAAGGGLGGTYPNPTVNYGIATGTACEGNDSRLSNSRAPTGAAGGDLSGTYPNPGVTYASTAGSAGTAGSAATAGSATVATGAVRAANAVEIVLANGVQVSTSATYARIGARKIDMSRYPATIAGLTRTVKFVTDADIGGAATGAQVKLSNITDLEDVTGADVTAASSTCVETESAALTVGSAAGNLRSDHAAMYEVYLKMNGGTPGTDQVICTNARLVITYA